MFSLIPSTQRTLKWTVLLESFTHQEVWTERYMMRVWGSGWEGERGACDCGSGRKWWNKASGEGSVWCVMYHQRIVPFQSVLVKSLSPLYHSSTNPNPPPPHTHTHTHAKHAHTHTHVGPISQQRGAAVVCLCHRWHGSWCTWCESGSAYLPSRHQRQCTAV